MSADPALMGAAAPGTTAAATTAAPGTAAGPAVIGAVSPTPASGTDQQCPQGGAGGQLKAGTVPADLDPWYRRAGSLCPQISPSLLAAQGKQESGFQRGLTSPSGAQGLAQFLPGTAASIDPDDGQPYVIDVDGKGSASLWDDGDAIMGQGRYMCHLARQIDQWKAQGKVSGDTASLALAAYNAGEGAVLTNGGVPPFEETQHYVQVIEASEPAFRATIAAPGQSGTGGSLGSATVDAARQWLGTPYVFGGGGPAGPSDGGLDGAGLTSAAVGAASGGRVVLPRTAEQQWQMGVEVPVGQAAAGDLVFGDWGPDGPSLVGVALGDGRMIVSSAGSGVGETAVTSDMRARQVM